MYQPRPQAVDLRVGRVGFVWAGVRGAGVAEIDRLAGKFAEDFFEGADTKGAVKVGRTSVPLLVRRPKAAAAILSLVVSAEKLGVDQTVRFECLVHRIPRRALVDGRDKLLGQRRVLAIDRADGFAGNDERLVRGGGSGPPA